MSWLKLTGQALYLMKSGSDCYVNKVNVSSSNQNPSELRLYIPQDWFTGRDVPSGMVVNLNGTEPDLCQIPVPSLPGGRTSVLAGKLIVLDPGHGEFQGGTNDPGAVNTSLGRNERDEVRRQADIVKTNLVRKGATVNIVENDSAKTLSEIGSEGRGADCFISLHLNAFNRQAQGHEVFVHSQGTAADERLATLINQELAAVLPITNRGVKRAGLGVLRGVPLPVPAVLTEGFFIDSVTDTATLDEWNTLAANAVAKGIEMFLTTL
ncbi:MAG: N-acetylmuramoyl-L-alanine amidase [Leptolyngbyaceae cyanobacterium]